MLDRELEKACLFNDLNKVKNDIDKASCDLTATNTEGCTALAIAAQEGHTEIVRALLEADINKTTLEQREKEEFTPLALAAFAGHRDVLEVLIEAGANIRAKNISGSTPLALAAERGHAEVIQRLIELGADVNVTDNQHETPLTVAQHFQQREAVKALLQCRETDIFLCNFNSVILDRNIYRNFVETNKYFYILKNE